LIEFPVRKIPPQDSESSTSQCTPKQTHLELKDQGSLDNLKLIPLSLQFQKTGGGGDIFLKEG